MNNRPPEIIKKTTTHLNRIEGQVRGIKRMVEEGANCDDVIAQILSVQKSIGSVAQLLVASHIKTCITPRLEKGDGQATEDLIKTVGRMM
ncbi:MAG: metal-sensing transcriptional repressor [Defluviitaleaceae bacterium]|nr:metal-sensing transcriptional repressor [Defluviitaleaceae bacterium]